MDVVIEGNSFAAIVVMLDLPASITVDELEDVYASFIASFGVCQPVHNTIDYRGELVGSVHVQWLQTSFGKNGGSIRYMSEGQRG